jgi:hypothetical protein
MSAAVASTDVYLNLLASRAITGLIRLARDPSVWNAAIQADLDKGVMFCEALEEGQRTEGDGLESDERFAKILKRLTSEVTQGKPGLFVSQEEIKKTCEYLRGLSRRTVEPNAPEITGSMKFFLKATSGQSARQKSENELFL